MFCRTLLETSFSCQKVFSALNSSIQQKLKKIYCVHAIQKVQISVQYLKQKQKNPVEAATTTRSARIDFNVLPLNFFFDNRETRISSNVLLGKVLISNFTIFSTLLLIKTANWKSLIVNR